jgi:xanthine/uracil permease
VIVSLAMEAIGDITASAEVSRVDVQGEEFDSRIQGGVLVCMFLLASLNIVLFTRNLFQSDGIGGFFSALFTVTPLSIFAQVSTPSMTLSFIN